MRVMKLWMSVKNVKSVTALTLLTLRLIHTAIATDPPAPASAGSFFAFSTWHNSCFPALRDLDI
jgi:hypothetical protein